MAKKPTPDAARLYRVNLKRTVTLPNGVVLKPGRETRVSKAVLDLLGDAVDGAEPV